MDEKEKAVLGWLKFCPKLTLVVKIPQFLFDFAKYGGKWPCIINLHQFMSISSMQVICNLWISFTLLSPTSYPSSYPISFSPQVSILPVSSISVCERKGIYTYPIIWNMPSHTRLYARHFICIILMHFAINTFQISSGLQICINAVLLFFLKILFSFYLFHSLFISTNSLK